MAQPKYPKQIEFAFRPLSAWRSRNNRAIKLPDHRAWKIVLDLSSGKSYIYKIKAVHPSRSQRMSFAESELVFLGMLSDLGIKL